jgi:Na+-transporting NADH:ubiquinone oxidoreductase subunit C
VHNNRYTFIYAAILTVVAAVLLALAAEGLRPMQESNIRLEKMSNILKAAKVVVEDPSKLEETYKNNVQEVVVGVDGNVREGVSAFDVELKDELSKAPADMNLPIFIYTNESGSKIYIMPLRGVGLWGPVWGFVSLEEDFNTVYGANFDHKGETPGLGAEISTPVFQDQFPGKKVFGQNAEAVALKVVKYGAEKDYAAEHRVDGISGGTITSVGVSDMIQSGISNYNNYFAKIRQSAAPSIPNDEPTLEMDSEEEGQDSNQSEL